MQIVGIAVSPSFTSSSMALAHSTALPYKNYTLDKGDERIALAQNEPMSSHDTQNNSPTPVRYKLLHLLGVEPYSTSIEDETLDASCLGNTIDQAGANIFQDNT